MNSHGMYSGTEFLTVNTVSFADFFDSHPALVRVEFAGEKLYLDESYERHVVAREFTDGTMQIREDLLTSERT